ncbi:MAG: DUF2461 domain-containing protein [Bacteroidota bacterium]
MPLTDFPPFPGFRAEGLAFLRALKQRNERDWFKPRKQTFDDELQWPMRCLVADFARRAPLHGLPLTADPKRSLFRIYRDTRFSKNKQPYKTHVSAVLSRSGGRKDPGSVYLHVEPGASFIAGGYWRPETALVRRWRARMVADPGGFLEMTGAMEAAGLPVSARESLKRMPRGFEAEPDSEIAEWLKAKSLIVQRAVRDDELGDPAFTDTVVETARAMLPLLAFGWEAMEPA